MPKMSCPNCGNPCEVLIEEDTGRKVGYCDPSVIDEKTSKPGCDFSFEIKKGKAKSSEEAKGLFVKITEDLSYHEKRISDLETVFKGKAEPTRSLTPWSV